MHRMPRLWISQRARPRMGGHPSHVPRLPGQKLCSLADRTNFSFTSHNSMNIPATTLNAHHENVGKDSFSRQHGKPTSLLLVLLWLLMEVKR